MKRSGSSIPLTSIILFLAAAILLYCALGADWFHFEDEGWTTQTGLFRRVTCWDGCQTHSLVAPHAWHAVDYLALATLLAMIATIAMAGITAAILLRPGRAVVGMIAAVGATIAAALAIAFTLATLANEAMQFGPAFFAFWPAVIAVIIGGLTAAQRVVDPTLVPMRGAVPMGGPVASAPEPYHR
jgi:hypothetical protein